jgi:hypothetical protein
LPGAQQGSPGPPQVAHIPVAVVVAPSQVRPVAHARAAAPVQQIWPSAAPQAMHIIALPVPALVVQRAPVSQTLFAQQTLPAEPHKAQIPLVSQIAPLLQLLPAQQA